MGELLRPHNTAQVKQRSHQSQQAKEGTGAESRSSTATRIFNGADLWAPHWVWLVWFFGLDFFLRNQSQVQTMTSMKEKLKKNNTHKQRNGGLQDKNKNIEARQDNTKQKAKAKHRLALNLSNGFTSSKR